MSRVILTGTSFMIHIYRHMTTAAVSHNCVSLTYMLQLTDFGVLPHKQALAKQRRAMLYPWCCSLSMHQCLCSV